MTFPHNITGFAVQLEFNPDLMTIESDFSECPPPTVGSLKTNLASLIWGYAYNGRGQQVGGNADAVGQSIFTGLAGFFLGRASAKRGSE